LSFQRELSDLIIHQQTEAIVLGQSQLKRQQEKQVNIMSLGRKVSEEKRRSCRSSEILKKIILIHLKYKVNQFSLPNLKFIKMK